MTPRYLQAEGVCLHRDLFRSYVWHGTYRHHIFSVMKAKAVFDEHTGDAYIGLIRGKEIKETISPNPIDALKSLKIHADKKDKIAIVSTNDDDRPPKNWSHIGNSFYIVRTQAGFKQAMKHFSVDQYKECRGYPISYPAVVSFSYDYNGSVYLRANVMHVKAVVGAILESEPKSFLTRTLQSWFERLYRKE